MRRSWRTHGSGDGKLFLLSNRGMPKTEAESWNNQKASFTEHTGPVISVLPRPKGKGSELDQSDSTTRRGSKEEATWIRGPQD